MPMLDERAFSSRLRARSHATPERHERGHRTRGHLEPRDPVVLIDLEEVDSAERRITDLRLKHEPVQPHGLARGLGEDVQMPELIAGVLDRSGGAHVDGPNRSRVVGRVLGRILTRAGCQRSTRRERGSMV